MNNKIKTLFNRSFSIPNFNTRKFPPMPEASHKTKAKDYDYGYMLEISQT